MARKIIHQLVDDLDGTVLAPGDGETVSFAFDGRGYEIDLTEKNAQALRDALASYIAVARSTSTRTPSAASRSRRSAGGLDLPAIRAWAAQNGHTISPRGRISATVTDAYTAAHNR